ncbi:hypothetical protein [Paenibacillus daejeonensis]|uniref:hypothetical protein n=1 Tax=Paenibacillus daejeonensis TaxID=135193 RepID=UPI0012F7A774|nr:hypothetical protein [Paenibacillus daejeonensis]
MITRASMVRTERFAPNLTIFSPLGFFLILRVSYMTRDLAVKPTVGLVSYPLHPPLIFPTGLFTDHDKPSDPDKKSRFFTTPVPFFTP